MCKHSYELFYEFNLISAILKLNEKKCVLFSLLVKWMDQTSDLKASSQLQFPLLPGTDIRDY